MASIRNRVNIPVGNKQDYVAEFVSFSSLADEKEHVALVFGNADKIDEPLVRIHSECLTGDIFHSARCDCGNQLQEAVETMGQSAGIILYLRQEGRGIGLYNKLDAYQLQDEGLDTFAANNHLGFDHDLRDFTVAAQMLQALGIKKINLLTNNPEKLAAMKNHGIEVVEHRTTGVFSNQHNHKYLKAKINVANHAITLKESDAEASDDIWNKVG